MKKKITYFILILLIIAFFGFIFFFKLLFADNIDNHSSKKEHVFYIHTGDSYSKVLKSLKEQHIIKDMESFKLVSSKLKYEESIKPGRYLIDNNTGNLQLVRKLRAGAQDPVKIT